MSRIGPEHVEIPSADLQEGMVVWSPFSKRWSTVARVEIVWPAVLLAEQIVGVHFLDGESTDVAGDFAWELSR